MFKIGDFSRLAHVSTRLLRHYDQLGLLRPAEIEPQSGYRFYRASQLTELNRILVLRDLGFALEQIRALLSDPPSVEQLRAMLMLRRAEVERELLLQSERLQELERRITDLEHLGTDENDDVRVRQLPACSYLSARVALPGFEAARTLAGATQVELPAMLGRRAARGLGSLLVIQHAPEFEPDALDLEIGFVMNQPCKIERTLSVAGHAFTVRELPKVAHAAVCVRIGPPEAVHASAAAVARAIEARGYRLSGPNRELFLKAPSASEPPVIEMQFPVWRVGNAEEVSQMELEK